MKITPNMKWNLLNGKTASLIDVCFMLLHSGKSNSFNFEPTDNCAAIFASGTFMDLLTKGIVLLALGFTSSTYRFSSLNANCILII